MQQTLFKRLTDPPPLRAPPPPPRSQPAEYFCSGVLSETAQYRHYALSVPLYTHFTSPIRRYPDVLVHRLLAAALKHDKPEQLPPQIVQR